MRIMLLSLALALAPAAPVVAEGAASRAPADGCVVSLWGEECSTVPFEPENRSEEAWASFERHLPLALKYVRDQAEAGKCNSAWGSASASGHPRLLAEARALCGERPKPETPPPASLIELW